MGTLFIMEIIVFCWLIINENMKVKRWGNPLCIIFLLCTFFQDEFSQKNFDCQAMMPRRNFSRTARKHQKNMISSQLFVILYWQKIAEITLYQIYYCRYQLSLNTPQNKQEKLEGEEMSTNMWLWWVRYKRWLEFLSAHQ